MAWAVPRYSKRQVNDAGRKLVAPNLGALEYVMALDIINNWRASHSFPLNTFQVGLRFRARQIDENCIVAQRIKRLSSIAQKLERFSTMTLSQMQDIGGCRAILSTAADVHQLCKIYAESEIEHRLHHKDDYIENPKNSGYRGVHLIYRYYSDKKETYNSLIIEMQIRSQFQHAWATAVETVGTFVGQALKSNRGEEDWLRFFALMGTAIANLGNTSPVANTPNNLDDLVHELRDHVHRLDIIKRLQGYGTALRVLEEHERKTNHYYLVVLDPGASSVRITGFRAQQSEAAVLAYLEVEKDIKDRIGADAVFVSVESL